MNDAAKLKTLRSYFRSDRKFLCMKRSTIIRMKRHLRRMERRVNRNLCKAVEA